MIHTHRILNTEMIGMSLLDYTRDVIISCSAFLFIIYIPTH